MTTHYLGLELLEFKNIDELHKWLILNHDKSDGIWIRLYHVKSKVCSIKFLEVLEEGLCFGWSESLRHGFDENSYVQKFTPRKSIGTTSNRNLKIVEKLIKENRMTDSGYQALGLTQ